MRRLLTLLVAATAITGCGGSDAPDNAPENAAAPAAAPALTLTRLDCGSVLVEDFSASFSGQEIYPHGQKRLTDSCYLIDHHGQLLLWDTGLTAQLKGRPTDIGGMVASLDATLPEQLATLGLKPADIDIVGISHMHADHTGQAAQFPSAKLVVGKKDFEQTAGKGDPFGPWRSQGMPVTLLSGDHNIFGDGTVTVLHMPGHTPDHLTLLVRLASGPVLLSGDLYHAAEARVKRGVPPFNTDRQQTLAAMDRFERLAKELNAKVIIQHEPADIAKLPAFPQAAK